MTQRWRLAYGGKRRIAWYEVFAGEKAKEMFGSWLPDQTVDAFRDLRIGIKGPLTTPIGGGIRSLNVALRQILDLYCCLRPVKYYKGIPSPVKRPDRMNIVIFRENTEDVYSGIEWKEGSAEAKKLIDFLNNVMLAGSTKKPIRADSGIGIKPMSITGTKRLVRMAIEFALKNKRPSVTLVHKGNIMKYTEGAFREWGYEVATQEFRELVVTERESWILRNKDNNPEITVGRECGLDRAWNGICAGGLPAARLRRSAECAGCNLRDPRPRPVEDKTADQRPYRRFDFPAGCDSCRRIFGAGYAEPERRLHLRRMCGSGGGLGIAPGANIGAEHAIFEATHGTAPKYADKDVINPGSVILSAVMMLEFMGWTEAALAGGKQHGAHHRAKAGDLRFRAADGRCNPATYERVCLGDYRATWTVSAAIGCGGTIEGRILRVVNL